MKKLILPIIVLALLIGGGQSIYTVWQNPNPTTHNINDITGETIPAKKWLELTNCKINITEASYFESTFGNGLAEEIYVPLRTNNDSIAALVAFKRKNLIDAFNLINTQTETDKIKHYLDKYKHIYFQDSLTLSGVVRYGIDLDQKEWRQLAQSYPKLIDGFIILDDNTAPSAGFAYFMFGLGLFLLIFVLKDLFTKKETVENT